MIRISTCFRFFACTAVLCAVAPFAQAESVPQEDVKGSHDHPLVSRFAGSTIIGYQAVDYDQMQLPMSKHDGDKISKVEVVEGKITRIAYAVPLGKSALEVYRNYTQALAVAGVEVRFECHSGEGDEQGCGHAQDLVRGISYGLVGPMHGDALMFEVINAISGDVYAMTARLQRPEGVVDLSLMVTKSSSGDRPGGVLLQIAEHQPMATGQVTVDAKAIGEGLAQSGHIALYGLSFASDSARIEAGSQATLEQMAKLLSEQPALKVAIVGHTDTTGSLAHNLELSQQRAEAVVAALVKDYHIAPARLLAKGMASFAPVASNDDEAGRARNRRVEMVKQ